MKNIKTLSFCLLCVSLISGNVYAEGKTISGFKLGFGFDQGFGLTGSLGKFNGFIGNDGVAIDYIFSKGKIEANAPMAWYIGGGGYGEWDGDLGARLPVGIELMFAKRWDGYAQIIPGFQFVDKSKFELKAGIGVRYQF